MLLRFDNGATATPGMLRGGQVRVRGEVFGSAGMVTAARPGWSGMTRKGDGGSVKNVRGTASLTRAYNARLAA